jgi:plastocyanin
MHRSNPNRPLAVALLALSGLALAVFLAACGEDEPAETGEVTGAVTHEVAIENFSFTPATLTIAVGDTVRGTNVDSAPHTATAGAPGAETGAFDSGDLAQSAVFSHTFAGAGDFAYFCEFHPGMRGNVTVE